VTVPRKVWAAPTDVERVPQPVLVRLAVVVDDAFHRLDVEDPVARERTAAAPLEGA
jgi:hypothetical protein